MYGRSDPIMFVRYFMKGKNAGSFQRMMIVSLPVNFIAQTLSECGAGTSSRL